MQIRCHDPRPFSLCRNLQELLVYLQTPYTTSRHRVTTDPVQGRALMWVGPGAFDIRVARPLAAGAIETSHDQRRPTRQGKRAGGQAGKSAQGWARPWLASSERYAAPAIPMAIAY